MGYSLLWTRDTTQSEVTGRAVLQPQQGHNSPLRHDAKDNFYPGVPGQFGRE